MASSVDITVNNGIATVEIDVTRGLAGADATVDQTIIDGSANAVSGNAVFDGLAIKAPLANPTFTGIVTAPRITGRCDGLEVFCKAGLAINAGQVVYVTGASGNNIIIGLAQANAELTSSKTIGISESTLATNGTGYVITEGLMTVSISAPSAIEGDPIWLSPSTAGGMVFGAANKPVAPNHMVYLGVVTRKTGNTIVEIFVKVQNGSELDELADVLITSPTAGQALMRGATNWENRSLVANDISNSTTAGRALLTAADAAAQRTSLGLGTAATTASTDYATAAQGTDERVPTAAGLTTKFGTAKATPVDADKVTILDSAASDAPKHSTLTAIWTWIQSKFAGASSKITPIDADSFNIVDSADSNAAKRVTGTNLKAFLKTYLDTLYVALTGDQTVAGAKTFSGQTELTGQAATNSTSAMTRLLAMKEPFYAVANIRRPVSPPSFGNSGTAGISAVAVAGDRWNLASGTANSGWARMTFARGINGSPPLSGSGINFSKKIGVSIVAVIGASVFTDNLNIFRLLVGSNQTPALDGVDATSYRSFGVEFKSRGSSHDWRVYGHNGTSITYSAWTNTGLAATEPLAAVIMIAVESDGVGNITAYLGYNGTRTLSTISTTGGPTTSGISTQAYIDAHVANSSSGTTSLPAAVYDAVLYFE